MTVNGNQYTYSTECTVISENHVVFNITIWKNFNTVCYTANVIINTNFEADGSIHCKMRGIVYELSNQQIQELLVTAFDNCRARAGFIFNKPFTKNSSEILNWTHENEE